MLVNEKLELHFGGIRIFFKEGTKNNNQNLFMFCLVSCTLLAHFCTLPLCSLRRRIFSMYWIFLQTWKKIHWLVISLKRKRPGLGHQVMHLLGVKQDLRCFHILQFQMSSLVKCHPIEVLHNTSTVLFKFNHQRMGVY